MEELTEEQRRAAVHGDGPACVIAGAGTGKTHVALGRVRYLVQARGYAPERILVTTFTRKATVELYGRLREVVGELAERLKIAMIDRLVAELADEAGNRGLLPQAWVVEDETQRPMLLRGAWNTHGQPHASSCHLWTDAAHKFHLVELLANCLCLPYRLLARRLRRLPARAGSRRARAALKKGVRFRRLPG